MREGKIQMETPFFLIDQSILEDYWRMLEESLASSWGNYQIGYSFKTNSLPWLIGFVKSKGAYAEVVSEDEYHLAKYLGFSDREIIYNGPYKGKTSFRQIALAGGMINIDSVREIGWLREIAEEDPDVSLAVGIRVNFNLEDMCPGETTMGEISGRFGFCYETGKLKEAIEQLRRIPTVRISGLHLHSSSKSRSVHVFKCIAGMACRLKKEMNLDLDYVDIGGGFCGGISGRPEYPDYFPEIAGVLREEYHPDHTKLIVEPGISLISKCTTFVSRVFDVRDIREFRYIMTDGSRFNLDPTMIKNSYFYRVQYCDNQERKVMDRQIVSGFSCMEADRMFEIHDGKELKPGDLIIYENVGGYTMSLNPLFIQYFPPVYVKNNGELKMVRKKWGPDEYVAGTEAAKLR